MALKFISPSGLECWLKSKEEFFTKYLVAEKPPRIPQNYPMSVGSSFDAYAKSFLHKNLFGVNHKDSPQFVFDTIFEKQVEPQNRDFALQAGAVCFEAYKQSGALSKLLELLNRSVSEPKFEFTAMSGLTGLDGVANPVNFPGHTHDDPVVLLGKPDLAFSLTGDKTIIYDWKVNGYCAKSAKTPTPGYLLTLPDGKMHKDAHPWEEDGLLYSLHPNIQLSEPSWGRQLAVYSWLTGAPVGSEIIVGIDQLCCTPAHPHPSIRVALHRSPITKEFQETTYKLFQEVWDISKSDHIFRDVSKEESQSRCKALSTQGNAYQGDDPNTRWLNSLRGK